MFSTKVVTFSHSKAFRFNPVSSKFKTTIQLRSEELEEQLKQELPGTSVHKEFSPLRNYSMDASTYRESAVAIHLLFDENDTEIILIKRTSYNGAHSRQIAFPGGKAEEADVNLEYTARRESYEEIGIPIQNGKCIGKLSTVLIPVSKFRVTPYIFIHKIFPKLIGNQREVDKIIKCHLSDLNTQTQKKFQDIETKAGFILKNIPGISYKGHFIWGATALMLHELNCIIKTLQIKKRNKP